MLLLCECVIVKVSLTLNVQAVGVFHMNGGVQNFINDLEYKKNIFKRQNWKGGYELW